MYVYRCTNVQYYPDVFCILLFLINKLMVFLYWKLFVNYKFRCKSACHKQPFTYLIFLTEIPYSGQLTCTQCHAGQYQPNTGQTYCTPCEVGTYQDQTGQLECKTCPGNTFTSSTGQTACMSCPGNCVVYQTTCLSERKSTCFPDCLCTLLYLLSWSGLSIALHMFHIMIISCVHSSW